MNEKNRWRRTVHKPIWYLAVAAVLLFGCLSAGGTRQVFADTITVDGGTCGAEGNEANVTWTLTKESEESTEYTLTISGTGKMEDYEGYNTYSTAPWDDYKEYIKTGVIEDGVTNIGAFTFYYCTNMSSVAIPEGVTGIGDEAFSGCAGLTSIEIPEGVTGIGDEAFSGCVGLTSIEIPEGVTSIESSAFFGCVGLTSIEIPEGVTSIGAHAFYGCAGLTSIEIPEGVTSIGAYAFYGCAGLTTIEIPEGVTGIGDEAFYGCAGLTSVTIPDSVKSIGELTFAYLRLTEVYLPHSWDKKIYDFNSVLASDGKIYNTLHEGGNTYQLDTADTKILEKCSNAKCTEDVGEAYIVTGSREYNGDPCVPVKTTGSLVGSIGSKLQTTYQEKVNGSWEPLSEAPTEIGEYRVTVTAGTGESAISISEEFTITPRKLTVDVRVAASVDFRTDGNYASDIRVLVKNCPAGVTFTAGTDYTMAVTKVDAADNEIGGTITVTATFTLLDTKHYVLDNGKTSFSKELTFSTKPVGGSCGATENDNVKWALTGTPANYTLTISGSGNMENYYDNGKYVPWRKGNNNAVQNISDIKEVIIKEGVTGIGDFAFSQCGSLTTVELPEGITSIGKRAFYECSGLTTVTIQEGVTSIGASAFEACTGLTSVTIPEGVMTMGDSAFSGCTGLTTVTIQEGVTSIGWGAFSGCTGLTTVTIPGSVMSIEQNAFSGCTGLTKVVIQKGVEYIGNNVFSGCSGLTEVVIPEGVMTIGEAAFLGCIGLTAVTIPEGVTSIGTAAFSGCTGLKAVTIPGSVMSIGEIAFYSCTGLTTVVIQNGVTSIGPRVFYSCTGLTAVTIPGSVTDIGDCAFQNCIGLTTLIIPDGVENIANMAFRGCFGLTTVTIPASITWLSPDAFENCRKITTVTMPCTLTYDFESLNKAVSITTTHGGKGCTYSKENGVLTEHCRGCNEDVGTATLTCADAFCNGESVNAALTLTGALKSKETNSAGAVGNTGEGENGGSFAAEIYYTKKGETTPLPTAPLKAGSYTAYARIPVNDSKQTPQTISVDFEIKYADIKAVATSPAENGHWMPDSDILAPEGYKIGTSPDGTFTEKLSGYAGNSTSAAGTTVTYYLMEMNETHYISAPKTITIYMDSLKPGIDQGAVVVTASTAEITYSISDLLTKVECRYLLKPSAEASSITAEEAFANGTEFSSGEVSVVTAVSLSGLTADTEYVLYVTARDEAGNISMKESSFRTRISGKSVTLERNYYHVKSYTESIDLSVYAKECINPIYRIVTGNEGESGTAGTATGGALGGSTGAGNTGSGNEIGGTESSGIGTATGSAISGSKTVSTATGSGLGGSGSTEAGNGTGNSGQSATADSVFSTEPQINQGVLTFTTKQGNIGESTSFEVLITSNNCDPITVNITVTLIGKLPVALRQDCVIETDGSLTYGEKLSVLGFKNNVVFVDAANSSRTVDGTLSWQDGSLKLSAGEAQVAWVFVSNVEEYEGTTGTITIIVNPAEIAPNAPENRITVDSSVKTVGEVSLPDGWEWNAADKTVALTKGKAVKATAIYIGEDKGNYRTEAVEISIICSHCNHTSGTEVHDKKDATCTETGYTGNVCCKDCGEVLTYGRTIRALGHIDKNKDNICDRADCGKDLTKEPVNPPTPTPTIKPSNPSGGVPTDTPAKPDTSTGTPTPAPTAKPGASTGTPTPAPTAKPGTSTESPSELSYNPETEWAPKDALKEWEKFYEVLLGTSAKTTSMIGALNVGETFDVNFYGVKNWKKENYTYLWTSSDETVATVDNLGNVTMISEGIAVIRLELIEKATGRKLSVAPMFVGTPEKTYDVFLGTSAKNAKILWELPLGSQTDLNFYGVKNWKKEDYEYFWTSSDEDIATVNKTGVVTARKSGIVVISLKMKDVKTGEYLKVAPAVVVIPEEKEEK